MPDATVVIITRNRRDVAANAVESALKQEGDVEVIVIDDASDDDTAGDLQRRFPSIRVHRSQAREGYIVHRNRGAQMATSPVIVSIDDDAVFGATDTVRKVVQAFDDPRVGAVSIPHMNTEAGKHTRGSTFAPDAEGFYVVAAFVGTAYALRRDLYLQLGGFEAKLFHWAEEDEYCRRMLGTGHVCRAVLTTPIEHFPHPRGRGSRLQNLHIPRNRILVPWTSMPLRHLPVRWVYASIGTLLQSKSVPMFFHYLEGLIRGYGVVLSGTLKRRPPGEEAYRLYEWLRSEKIASLDSIKSRLPPL